nr:bifunctional adenosylcobinamide kinase/adenosylcobinamide-phosphate guanylyltransferase [uncultured Butyricicoccus sp.]
MNILIIGGAYQGKRQFAMKQFGLSSHDIADGAHIDLEQPFYTPAIMNIHILVRRMLQAGKNTDFLFTQLENHIVLCDEIGCGVVPISEEENQWRETVGRLCCALAERADKVYWLRAGISQCIKGNTI